MNLLFVPTVITQAQNIFMDPSDSGLTFAPGDGRFVGTWSMVLVKI